jgi:two-component system alkaline phosphatase synthesis response regulator PhoP
MDIDLGKKILIVDDDEAIRKSLVYQFKKSGFMVVEAVDGEDGLQKALLEKPDIILLDIMMPNKDGIEMLRDLRDDEWGSDVPVIFLTNASDTDRVSEAINLGVYDYLVKSDWNLEDVVKTVKGKLGI